MPVPNIPDVIALSDTGAVLPPPPPQTELYHYPLPAPPLIDSRPVMNRNALGQYLLPNPVTGVVKGHTRMTSLVHTLDDDYSLSQWQRRQWATGGYVAAIEHTNARIAGVHDEDYLPTATRHDRDAIADAAEAAVDMGRAAEFGTAVHAWTEVIDHGHPLAVVPDGDDCAYIFRDTDPRTGHEVQVVRTLRSCVADYLRIRSEAGLIPLPDHIERTVFLSVPSGLYDAAGQMIFVDVMGTYDRIYLDHLGRQWLGDLKTSRRLDWSWNSFSAQLEGYASASWVWDAPAGKWCPSTGSDRIHGLVVMSVPSAPVSLTQPLIPRTVTLDRGRGRDLLQLAARLRVERRAARARDLSQAGPVLDVPDADTALRHRILAALQAAPDIHAAAAVYREHEATIARLGVADVAQSFAALFPR